MESGAGGRGSRILLYMQQNSGVAENYGVICNKPPGPLNLPHSMSHHEAARAPQAQPLFATTRWSVVLAAQDQASPAASAALETLCRVYWYPIYALVRREGHSPYDAQDLTQEFFARLLEKDYLQAADRERGRLRTFLRVALKRFLLNEWDRLRAQRRGGGICLEPLDTSIAEARYQLPGAESLPADRIYERQWAMSLLDQAMARLRSEHEASGRVMEFEILKSTLTAERGGIPYAALAASLGCNEGAVRVSVHRLRKRFREMFRAIIADTVQDAAEVGDEVRYVARLLSDS